MTAAHAPDNAEERQAQARAAWVEETAAQLSERLADPEVRAEVLALLNAPNPVAQDEEEVLDAD